MSWSISEFTVKESSSSVGYPATAWLLHRGLCLAIPWIIRSVFWKSRALALQLYFQTSSKSWASLPCAPCSLRCHQWLLFFSPSQSVGSKSYRATLPEGLSNICIGNVSPTQFSLGLSAWRHIDLIAVVWTAETTPKNRCLQVGGFHWLFGEGLFSCFLSIRSVADFQDVLSLTFPVWSWCGSFQFSMSLVLPYRALWI